MPENPTNETRTTAVETSPLHVGSTINVGQDAKVVFLFHPLSPDDKHRLEIQNPKLTYVTLLDEDDQPLNKPRIPNVFFDASRTHPQITPIENAFLPILYTFNKKIEGRHRWIVPVSKDTIDQEKHFGHKHPVAAGIDLSGLVISIGDPEKNLEYALTAQTGNNKDTPLVLKLSLGETNHSLPPLPPEPAPPPPEPTIHIDELPWIIRDRVANIDPASAEKIKKMYSPMNWWPTPELHPHHEPTPQFATAPKTHPEAGPFIDTIMDFTDIDGEVYKIPVYIHQYHSKRGEITLMALEPYKLLGVRPGIRIPESEIKNRLKVPMKTLTHLAYAFGVLETFRYENQPKTVSQASKTSSRWNTTHTNSLKDPSLPEEDRSFRLPAQLERITVGFGQTPQSFATALEQSTNGYMKLHLPRPISDFANSGS